MADSTITGLTELTSVADADLTVVVDDVGGTPITKKSTVGNLLLAGFLDEDDMASNSATKAPVQQSVKAYVDSGTVTMTNKTLTSPVIQGDVSGWTASTDTWTYASASTFTISGVDRTAIYTPGTRLKFTQTTAKYAVVVSSAFSTNTTVTIAVNTDYTIANAAITAPYYSYQANPQGYPHWFSYTASITGFSANPSMTTRFCIVGTSCTVVAISSTNGTSNATGFTISVPVTAKTIANHAWRAWALVVDNGTAVDGSVYITSAGTAINFYKAAAAAFTNSGNKSGNMQITYEI